jgi:hypothetical protein
MSTLTGVLAGILLLTLSWVRAASARRALRLHRVERKIDAMLADADALDRLFPPVSDRVRALITAGKRIEAIRSYRTDHPSVALKDANEVVSAIMHPDSPRRPDLGRIELKVDALLRAYGLDDAASITIPGEARESVAAGRLVDAVTSLRAENPTLSLTEARDIARALRS